MADPMRAFVYMVESPNAVDLFDGRTEGQVLWEVLKLANVEIVYRLTTSLKMFDHALTRELSEYARASKNKKLPILHVSAHGDPDGIELTDGERLDWDDFRHRLIPVNKELDGLLIVGLSTCDGASARRMAMWETGAPPFGILFGHEGPGSWSDLAIGFAAFYHRFIHKNSGLSKALDAMKMASGSDCFKVLFGPGIQSDWIKYYENRQSGQSHEEAVRFLTPRGGTKG